MTGQSRREPELRLHADYLGIVDLLPVVRIPDLETGAAHEYVHRGGGWYVYRNRRSSAQNPTEEAR